MMPAMIYDICIIGGGINGAGIARDAAGRGLKVLLLEQGDLASATSSSSSKMIHGGLRYLEFFEFGLVRKSLAEREVLMNLAPQFVWPLKMCIPHRNTVRPAWMVRLGLFLYDRLWPRRFLEASGKIDLATHDFGKPLEDRNGAGFTYADCWVDDARLVLLNAMDARNRGADIRTYIKCTGLKAEKGKWIITAHNRVSDEDEMFEAKTVVNATGPYARKFLEDMDLSTPETPKLRLVQGSHIVVPRLYSGSQAYLLQQPDKRVVFVFPYEDVYSLVGTTETPFEGNPSQARITKEEKKYLCDAVNQTFKRKITPKHIIWHFSGVRPLFDDNAGKDSRKVTRDYRLYTDQTKGPMLLTVFGGKLTTYRPLAEEVLNLHLKKIFPVMKGNWTANSKLPTIHMKQNSSQEDLLRYFKNEEWAVTLNDILWRRTKWGLHLLPEQKKSLQESFDKISAKD